MGHRPLAVLGLAALLIAGASPVIAARPVAGIAGGRAIVVLRDGVARPVAVARSHGVRRGAIDHVYRHALKGYAGTFSGPVLAALRSDPRVARVVPDGVARISETQTGATWGIDRIDQRNRPLSTTYEYTSTAPTVTAYVIDTGIRTTHTGFGGRASIGFDAFAGSLPAGDCNGHGTHVAGTIGSATWGVAKQVKLVSVRVLDCGGSGTWSGVIAGIDYVTRDHDPGEAAVANMSLGGGANSAVDAAVSGSIADGVVYAVAAGNSNADACRYSPARTAAAITVGATTSTDARASYSNHGPCVDIHAPGSSITSAWHTSDGASATLNGTSMATPHVAGAAARYLAGQPAATPAQVASALIAASTPGLITGFTKKTSKTPNRLLYVAPGS